MQNRDDYVKYNRIVGLITKITARLKVNVLLYWLVLYLLMRQPWLIYADSDESEILEIGIREYLSSLNQLVGLANNDVLSFLNSFLDCSCYTKCKYRRHFSSKLASI